MAAGAVAAIGAVIAPVRDRAVIAFAQAVVTKWLMEPVCLAIQ